MKKTVNQWIDWIDSLPKEQRMKDEINIFRDKLMQIKADMQNNGFGGAVNVVLPKSLENIIIQESKSN